MHKILHRINTIEALENTPLKYGVEVDIRSFGKDLVIHHDPFEKGQFFEDWIKSYRHGTLILNVKEEGLEEKLIKLMKFYSINNFFFLDQSFPFLRKTAINGESRCAVRISEYESIDTAFNLKGIVQWAWIDCFTKFPLKLEDAEKLQKHGIKLCFVSPELQGYTDYEYVKSFRNEILQKGIKGDAVCTKYPNLWD
jgi:hypothetical protein